MSKITEGIVFEVKALLSMQQKKCKYTHNYTSWSFSYFSFNFESKLPLNIQRGNKNEKAKSHKLQPKDPLGYIQRNNSISHHSQN